MNNKRIGKNISTLRLRRGFTQEMLAELSGVSPEHISHIERGHSGISMGLLLELCDALTTTPNDILEGEFEEIRPKDGLEIFLDGYPGIGVKEKKLIRNIMEIIIKDYIPSRR